MSLHDVAQIAMIIMLPILGYIGGYFNGMTKIIKQQNEESRKRILQMIEDRNNGTFTDRVDNWYN